MQPLLRCVVLLLVCATTCYGVNLVVPINYNWNGIYNDGDGINTLYGYRATEGYLNTYAFHTGASASVDQLPGTIVGFTGISYQLNLAPNTNDMLYIARNARCWDNVCALNVTLGCPLCQTLNCRCPGGAIGYQPSSVGEVTDSRLRQPLSFDTPAEEAAFRKAETERAAKAELAEWETSWGPVPGPEAHARAQQQQLQLQQAQPVADLGANVSPAAAAAAAAGEAVAEGEGSAHGSRVKHTKCEGESCSSPPVAAYPAWYTPVGSYQPRGFEIPVRASLATSDFQLGLLYSLKFGPFNFFVSLCFSDFTWVTVKVNGSDWRTPFAPGSPVYTPLGVASQEYILTPVNSLRGFETVQSDFAVASNDRLSIQEAIIDKALLLNQLNFDVTGKTLLNITIGCMGVNRLIVNEFGNSYCGFEQNFYLGPYRNPGLNVFAMSMQGATIAAANPCTGPLGNPCRNGGSCSWPNTAIAKPTCACPAGFTDLYCSTNINDCLALGSNPCLNGGGCVDGINSWACGCVTGYSGQFCEILTNNCLPNPCTHGAACTNMLGDFNCSCPRGWAGKTCADIDFCVNHPCQNGGWCVNAALQSTYTCLCPGSYRGQNCSTAAIPVTLRYNWNGILHQPLEIGNPVSFRCPQDRALVALTNTAYGADYAAGGVMTGATGLPYAGFVKTPFVLDCLVFRSLAQQRRYNQGVYNLVGPADWALNQGSPYPASNGNTDYLYDVMDIKMAVRTETNFELGFLFQGTAINDVTAADFELWFTDGTEVHFTLKTNNWYGCDASKVPPPPGPGVRIQQFYTNSGNYNCFYSLSGDIPSGGGPYQFTALNLPEAVVDRNKILTDFGIDVAGKVLYNLRWHRPVVESTGQGDANAIMTIYAATVVGANVPNFCAVALPCRNGGTCNAGAGTYSCDCVPGFVGEFCETNVDDCPPLTCLNNGECIDGVQSFLCNCTGTGYKGTNCGTQIDFCQEPAPPCLNGATCLGSVGSFLCECTQEWAGATCAERNYCANNTCGAGQSTCVSQEASMDYRCACFFGWQGDFCTDLIPTCTPRNPCMNGGTCTQPGPAQFVCLCVDGYVGLNCESRVAVGGDFAMSQPFIMWDTGIAWLANDGRLLYPALFLGNGVPMDFRRPSLLQIVPKQPADLSEEFSPSNVTVTVRLTSGFLLENGPGVVPLIQFDGFKSGSSYMCGVTPAGFAVCSDGPDAPLRQNVRSTGVAVTADGACALLLDSSVMCWGALSGAINVNARFVKLAAGSSNLCGLTTDGFVRCTTPLALGDDFGDRIFGDIYMGGSIVCARRTSGMVECHGCAEDGLRACAIQEHGPFATVAIAQNSTCGVTSEHVVHCFGMIVDVFLWDAIYTIPTPMFLDANVYPAVAVIGSMDPLPAVALFLTTDHYAKQVLLWSTEEGYDTSLQMHQLMLSGGVVGSEIQIAKLPIWHISSSGFSTHMCILALNGTIICNSLDRTSRDRNLKVWPSPYLPTSSPVPTGAFVELECPTTGSMFDQYGFCCAMDADRTGLTCFGDLTPQNTNPLTPQFECRFDYWNAPANTAFVKYRMSGVAPASTILCGLYSDRSFICFGNLVCAGPFQVNLPSVNLPAPSTPERNVVDFDMLGKAVCALLRTRVRCWNIPSPPSLQNLPTGFYSRIMVIQDVSTMPVSVCVVRTDGNGVLCAQDNQQIMVNPRNLVAFHSVAVGFTMGILTVFNDGLSVAMMPSGLTATASTPPLFVDGLPRLTPRTIIRIDAQQGSDSPFCGIHSVTPCRTMDYTQTTESQLYKVFPILNTLQLGPGTFTMRASAVTVFQPGFQIRGAGFDPNGELLSTVDMSGAAGFLISATAAAWSATIIVNAQRGVLLTEGGSMTMSHLRVYNSTGSAGQPFLVADTNTHFRVLDSRFIGNRNAGNGGALRLQSKTTLIENTQFERNQAQLSGGAVYIYNVGGAMLTITGSQFTDNQAFKHGGGLFISGSTATLVDVHASGNVAVGDGGFLMVARPILLQTIVTLQDSALTNNAARRGGAVMVQDAILNLRDAQLIGNNASTSGGAVFVGSSSVNRRTVTLQNTLVSHNRAGDLLYARQCSEAQFAQRASLLSLSGRSGGALSCASTFDHQVSLEVSGSNFTDNIVGGFLGLRGPQGGAGGAVVGIGCDMVIDGSNFARNQGGVGGAVFSGKGSVAIAGSAFDANSACRGAAGTTVNSATTVRSSRFRNQVALGLGGVFFMDGASLDIDALAVPDCASNVRSAGTGVSAGADTTAVDCTTVDVNSSPVELRVVEAPSGNLTAGKPVFPLSLAMYDARNVRVKDDAFTVVSVELIKNATLLTPDELALGYLTGAYPVSFDKNGLATFSTNTSGLSLFGPADFYTIGFTAQVTLYDGVVRTLTTHVLVSVQPCDPGYTVYDLLIQNCKDCPEASFAIVNGTCALCPAGRFGDAGLRQCLDCPVGTSNDREGQLVCPPCDDGKFTLFPQTLHCYNCPENANCHNNTITADYDGFYLYGRNVSASTRDNSYVQLYACPPNLCLANLECADNRQGALCGECIDGYSEWSGECVECEGVNWGLVVAIIILSFVYVLWVHAGAQNGERSATMKVFMFFVQIALFIAGDVTVGTLFTWTSFMNIQPQETPTSGCIAALDPWQKLAVTVLTPVVILLELVICCVVYRAYWTLRNQFCPNFRMGSPLDWLERQCLCCCKCLFKRNAGARLAKQNQQNKPVELDEDQAEKESRKAYHDSKGLHFPWKTWQRSLGALLIYSYSSFAEVTIVYLNCVEVGVRGQEEYRRVVFQHPGIDCDDARYKAWFVFIAFLFVVDVIGFPLALFWFLYKRRTQAYTQRLRGWGLFWESYRKSVPWWESISLLRRVVFVIIGTAAYHSPYRHTAFAIFSWFCLAIHVHFQPFNSELENKLETASLSFLSLISILLAASQYPHPEALAYLVTLACLLPTIAGIALIVMVKGIQKYNKSKQRASPLWMAPYDVMDAVHKKDSVVGDDNVKDKNKDANLGL